MKSKSKIVGNFSPAFTIVELLVVIVVIAILATITIISYGNISKQARIAALSSDLNQANKSLQNYKETTSSNETYPSSLATANIKTSGNITYTYNVTSNSTDYCLEGTTDGTTKSITGTDQSIVSKPCTENGLVGWWKMNSDASDSSGLSNDGTISGAITATGQNGITGRAMSFDGGNDYIDIQNNSTLNPPNGITVAAWIKWNTNTNQWEWLVAKNSDSGASTGYALLKRASYDEIGFIINNKLATISRTYFSENQWYYLVGTASPGDYVRLYVNGSPLTVSYGYGRLNTISYYSGNLGINKTFYYSSPNNFNGSIDDVRIYNRALSASEIQQLYSAGAQ